MIGLGVRTNKINAGGATPPPVNTVAPVVSGTAVVGQTLTTTNGTWTNSPTSYTYQWYRGASAIGGATSSTYVLVQADAGNTSNIKCVVTATNAVGSANANSNTISQVLDATWNDFKTTLSISDSTINNAMNTYIISRKTVSTTASIAAYPMVGGTSTTCSRNLYNAANTDAAKRITWSGTIAFDANGVQGNGINGTGNTFINSLNDFTNTDFTILWYSRTNSAAAQTDFGALSSQGSIGLQVSSKWIDGNTYTAAQSNALASAININTSGCFCFKRIGNIVTLTRNGSNIFTLTDTGSGRVNYNIFILSRNFDGSSNNYSSRQYTHFEFMNFGLTLTQESNLINAIIAKETSLGRNV